MRLSVIVPVYNEVSSVLAVVERVRNCGVADLEVLVVDDCSTDGTAEKLKELSDKPSVRVIRHSSNMGKGAAIRTAQKLVTGDVVVIQDADLEYDPAQFPKMLDVMVRRGENDKVDAVFGSRYCHTRNGDTFLHWFGNKFFTVLSNLFSGYRLTDMETCYKMIRSDIFKAMTLECNKFGFEPEIVAKLSKRGCKIAEVPIAYCPRSYDAGKKIGFLDGMAAVWHILKYNLLDK